MPVYNAERYVAEAVASILNQTFGDFEFLIIDDGSTDRSLQILRKYERQDARIRLISRPNTGYVAALNEMLAMARGEFVARMDADDIAYPDRFGEQLKHLRTHPRCVLVGSRVLLIDPDGAPLCHSCHQCRHEEIDEALVQRHWPLVHPAVMMKREAVAKVGGYRVQYTSIEDRDLFLRLAEIGELANLPQTLLQYRKHLDSVCHTRYNEQRSLQPLVDEDMRRRRGLPPARTPSEPQTRTTPSETYATWAWCALIAGNVKTARKYAWKIFRSRPASLSSLKLVACALRGH